MRKLPANTCLVVYFKPTLDRAVRSFSRVKVRKCLKFAYLLIFLELQGILHAVCHQHVQRACALPIDDKFNGRCVVANEMSSSEYEGSNGQLPVKWHCSSECNTVTEAEVAAIVHLKQAFKDASHPIHPTQLCTLY